MSLGMDDFAGTGFFSREYFVATQDYNNVKLSLGIGWGKFAAKNSFKNPLSIITDKFLNRPLVSKDSQYVGTPTYDQWFRGEASYFGGIEYHIPSSRGIKLKLEYDPFDYLDFSANNRVDAINEIRKKDSDINFGVSIPINDYFTIDASLIKGNTFNVNFNFGIVFNKFSKKPKFIPVIEKENISITKSKNEFYLDLLSNLNKNNLFLQTANLNESGDLDVSISTSNHRNAIRSSSYASYISKTIADLNDIELNTINIKHINAGVELNNIKYIAQYLEGNKKSFPLELIIRNTTTDSGNEDSYRNHEFKPRVNFPITFSTLKPTLVSHIGFPAKFFYGGLNLQLLNEVQFNRNLILTSEINQHLYSNLDNAISKPDSVMENVRTRVIKYLQEDDVHVGRFQLDYIWSPYKNTYAKISGGIFESMFGGIGGEILYKPFKRDFHIGAEIFHVKQRTFKQRFDFQDYSTTTGHINLGYKLPAGIEANLSFGRYLAKDDGYTLDLARRTNKGFLAGVYFTRTNVPARIFGEGSFDKGFYFQFPLDFFSKDYSNQYSTFKLSPLTRDGGARLIHAKDLKGIIYNTTFNELDNQWNGFLN